MAKAKPAGYGGTLRKDHQLARDNRQAASKAAKGKRVRLIGDGTAADAALLDALVTVLHRKQGEILADGLRLVLAGADKGARELVDELTRRKLAGGGE